VNTFQYTLTLDAFTAGGEQFPADSLTFTTNGLGQTPDLAGLSLYSQPLGFAQNVGNGMYMEIYSAEASVLYPPPLTAPEFLSVESILLPTDFPVGESVETTHGNNYFLLFRTGRLEYFTAYDTGTATVHATVPEPAVFGLLVVALALGALVARFRRHAMQE